MFNKILIVKKISSLRFHYGGESVDQEILESDREQEKNFDLIKKFLDTEKKQYKVLTREELKNENVSEYDLVISAGGDGTVIATAAYNLDVPQLNLRLDEKSKGALCQHNLEEALKKTLNKKYSLDNWTRQDVFLNEQLLGRSLNDTCVGEGKYGLDFSKMAVYDLKYSDEKNIWREGSQKNSGLIIVTGTGSTAWGKTFSAYSRKDGLLKFSTVLPNEGEVNSGQGNYFKITYKHHEGKIALDTVIYNFPRNSILEIKLSEHPLRVIVPDLS